MFAAHICRYCALIRFYTKNIRFHTFTLRVVYIFVKAAITELADNTKTKYKPKTKTVC